MTRIQNGGRGDGKWKNELFFFKLPLFPSLSPYKLGRTVAMVGNELSTWVVKERFNVDFGPDFLEFDGVWMLAF